MVSWPYGNVNEAKHEVIREIDRLIGGSASRNNLARQKQLIRLLMVIDAVRSMSCNMSADRYLQVINQIQQMEKEIK